MSAQEALAAISRLKSSIGSAESDWKLTVLEAIADWPLANEDVGGETDGAQLLHRVLGRLGLQLARGLYVGQQRQVHEDALAARLVLRELADRLEEGQALDVADGAADLAEHEIDLVIPDVQEVLDFQQIRESFF